MLFAVEFVTFVFVSPNDGELMLLLLFPVVLLAEMLTAEFCELLDSVLREGETEKKNREEIK